MQVAWQVEIDPFCCKVLKKHWPGVKRYGDIRKLDPGELEPVDLLCGGPPCQPASVAGKRGGTADDRWLWPEILRVVAALSPRWIFFENPTGILSLQGGVPFESVLSELEAEGYWNYEDLSGRKRIAPIIVPACAVDAPHRRDRVWIMAYAQGIRRGAWRAEPTGQQGEPGFAGGGQNVGNPVGRGLPREPWRRAGEKPADGYLADEAGDVANTCREGLQESQPERQLSGPIAECGGRPIESRLGGVFNGLSPWLDGHLWPAPYGCEQYDWEPPRVAKGVPHRTARIEALGNAVVPHLVEVIGRAILAAEEGENGLRG